MELLYKFTDEFLISFEISSLLACSGIINSLLACSGIINSLLACSGIINNNKNGCKFTDEF
jgi:hypothetical protein